MAFKLKTYDKIYVFDAIFHVNRPFPTHLYIIAIAKFLFLHTFSDTPQITYLLIKLKNRGCPEMYEGGIISKSLIVTNV